MTQKKYRISDDGKSITCLHCGMKSFNINDVNNLYCGRCHKFHDITYDRVNYESITSISDNPKND